MALGEPVTVVLKFTVYERNVFDRLGWGEVEIEAYHADALNAREEFGEAASAMLRDGEASAPDVEVWSDGVKVYENV